MALLPGFQFSQNSLQDFVDCPRRFYLRYVRRAAWPAAVAGEALEYERHMQQGAAFHRLVQQHVLGISILRLSRIVAEARDPDLSRWWANYLTRPPADLPPARYPEVMLSTPAAGHRLVARYDLVAVGSEAVIVDWKTSRKRLRRVWLAARLQTRVYCYVLVRAGAHLNGGAAFAPEQVSMRYWFADFPDEPEHFAYGEAGFDADGAYLTGLIEDIKAMAEDDFVLTEDAGHCRFCVYRSLCDRGAAAGPLSAIEDVDGDAGAPGELDFDFDQVQEVEF
ncbi:MAG: PD-(D/E)XK nuclease family protein [Anaerolineae bacterium]|nr:PD-(D/E)XK nuclease family protein [Anaerolineae bacterium]